MTEGATSLPTPPLSARIVARIKEWIQPMTGPVHPNFFSQSMNAEWFAKFGAHLPGGQRAREELTPRELAERAIAQYLATHEMLETEGPIWLRSLVFGVFIVSLAPVLLFRKTMGRREHQRVVGIAHFPEFVGYVKDAGGDDTFAVSSPRPRLALSDFRWLLSAVRRAPRLLAYPEIFFRTMLRCGTYAELIRAYQCAGIVDFMEHTPTAPLAYWYCREHGASLINAMHGDRDVSVAFGFGAFSKMAIWGEHYRDAFKRLHCAAEEFFISGCSRHRLLGALRRVSPRPRRIIIMYEVTFAPGSPFLAGLCDFVSRVGAEWAVSVRVRMRRPHERALVPHFLAELRAGLGERAADLTLSDPETTPMWDDLARSSIAVAVYSSALMEAWLSGCQVMRIAPPDAKFSLYPPPYAKSPLYHVYEGPQSSLDWMADNSRADDTALLRHVSVSAAEGASADNPASPPAPAIA